jgi:outer membrane protein
LASGFLAIGWTAPASGETLTDALLLAYQSNPTLLSERAQLQALNESYVQARAGLRPQASVSAEFDYTKDPSTFESEYDAASLGVSITQPIYTGGAVTSQIRAALADIMSGRQKLRQTEASVLESVIQAYVDVRRDIQALAIARNNVQLLSKQLEEIQARLQVGDLTRTDQAQAQARLAQAHAEVATAQAQLAISRANYASVVGQAPGNLAPEPPLPALPATLDAAFEVADHNNGGVLAADFAERAAAARVAQAKAAYRPTLSVRATLGESGTPAIYGTYALTSGLVPGGYGQNFTASAVLTQPLFTGGMNASNVRQALENDNVQRIGQETARRDAVQAVSQSWYQLIAARGNVTSDENQIKADKVAFEGAREEAQAGLRTTIEALNAEQELEAAQQALVVARHDEYVASANLLSAMGLLEGKTLLPGVKLYDPKRAFDKVRHTGPSMPWDGAVAKIDSLGAPGVPREPAQAAHAGSQVVQ